MATLDVLLLLLANPGNVRLPSCGSMPPVTKGPLGVRNVIDLCGPKQIVLESEQTGNPSEQFPVRGSGGLPSRHLWGTPDIMLPPRAKSTRPSPSASVSILFVSSFRTEKEAPTPTDAPPAKHLPSTPSRPPISSPLPSSDRPSIEKSAVWLGPVKLPPL